MSFNKQAVVFLAICASLQTLALTTQVPSPKDLLTPSQKQLVEASRKAVIQTGISESYFSAHFRLVRAVDSESDRRVMWEFEVNGHKTIVSDSIGFYTQGNQRIAIHSVLNSLGRTFDIHRTLTRAAALKRLRICVGRFENPSVEYGAIDGRAELVLSAERSVDRRSPKELANERQRERQREEPERKKASAGAGDMIESEEEEKDVPRVIIGSINLVSGKCTKGAGQIAP